MAETLEFEVDDTSPAISYYPFRDTFSTPNLTAGWNPYFSGSGFLTSSGETGEGTSLHISSLNGASLSIQWHGTGIQLYGNVTNASYVLTLDETTIDISSLERSDTMLASISGLSSISHNITLTAQITTPETTGSMLVFDKAVITATSPTNVSSNLNFTLQTITDSRINFNGEWSFNNGLGQAFRESNKAGDTARVSFFGTSFLVLGTTSPAAGNYSVTVDNIQTFLSAKSSFTQDSSLLYYATGLDPDLVHDFEISNEDGSSLKLPTPNPTASATPAGESIASGYPPGTIAALALAGVLAFILLTGLFFFLFVYRPRRRRSLQHQRQQKDEQWKKESEAGGVLDIAPLPKTHSRERRRDSDWSRWKRDIEGTDGLGIDIVFRHSDSIKEEGDVDHIESPNNPQRSPEPTSLAQRNNKGKGRWFGKTDKERSSPSFTIDLPLPPILRSRSASRQGSENGNAARQRSRSNSAISYLTSFSSASFASRKSSNASSRSRDRLPVPRPKSHLRTSSQRPLLQYEITAPEAPPRPTRLRPLPQPPRPISDGSGQDYIDDAVTVLGPSTSQTALRHLSPRPSETFTLQARPTHEEQQPLASTSEPVDYTRGRLDTRPSLLDCQCSHVNGGFLAAWRVLSVMERGQATVLRVASRVRFEESEAASTNDTSESDYPDSHRLTVDNVSQDDPTPSGRSAFRLTPLHPMAPAPRVTSFLDLSGSSDASIRTRSNDNENETLASSHRISSERQPASRWSSTTAPSSHGHALESSSPSSTTFPFPVSLPASSHHPTGHRLSPPPTLPTVPDDQLESTARIHRHPLSELAPLSPADSVPLSVSDLHFRQSVSDEAGERRPRSNGSLPALPMNMSLLPRHPPLPGHGTGTERM
ncbi:uncharacterized protein EV420DRAFT_1735277 [Desarmillaria tabescens]|uniref:Uncharacterized protein n=1 Tax=Armillaria tabescens TaxID=1929756 RepID=A0AA39TQ53_ARMTA|nr:uncharacterized protein EV420DRAFT_1735277 [Desarmillaria tabescens]KAK0462598.1 hypothetical protein EV420DRAFT_1735277 [Desarmillaria tabescens]